jgi:hypothetical protein
MSPRLPLLAASLLLAACETAPLTTDIGPQFSQADKAANSNGLFRLNASQVPFYARAEPPSDAGGFAYRTDEWAAIVFYRQPACVPQAFDLFQFYDVPGAFACTPTTDGHALHVEPLGITPPKTSHLSGNAVPIWFVPWSGAFEQAVNDGVLTMAQLSAMPGLLKGVATQFQENLATIENHPVPKINVTARGYILPESGGGSFRYNVNWPGLTVATVRNVQIVIE